MNDCLWYNVMVCENCEKCDKYLSMNSDRGSELRKEYEEEIEKALVPVKEAFKNKHYKK